MTTAIITVGGQKERITHNPRHSLVNIAGLSFLHEREKIDGNVSVTEPCCDCEPKVLKKIAPGETITFEAHKQTITVEHKPHD